MTTTVSSAFISTFEIILNPDISNAIISETIISEAFRPKSVTLVARGP